MSGNEPATNNTGAVNDVGVDETGATATNAQIWGTTGVTEQNAVHYPAPFSYGPSQIGNQYDMSAYTAPVYQYGAGYNPYTSEGYQQNYDESFQTGEGLQTYDGSTATAYYQVPGDQTGYYAEAQDGGQSVYNKKAETAPLLDNTSEYTARWVSSTTQIPASLKVSPDHPVDAAVANAADYSNWDELQADGMAAATQQQVQQEALDQQLALMNLGFGQNQQQFASYGYQVGGSATQPWQGAQDKRTDQNGTLTTRTDFFEASGTPINDFSKSVASSKPGAPAQATWAEMVKKNGASAGDVKIVRQPPFVPQQQQVQGGPRNQSFQQRAQNPQRFDRSYNGPKSFNKPNNGQGNTRGIAPAAQNQQHQAQYNNYYGNQQQQQPTSLMNRFNTYQPRNNAVMGPRMKTNQNRGNMGYGGGYGTNVRPGTSAPPQGNYQMPNDYNPYVPPPLLQFNQHAPAASQGSGFQQSQGAPMYSGNPYVMFNPAQQQMRYFNPQFVRPEPLMPPMYNDPYFQMRFRPPFEFDPRFGPQMYGMPRFRYPRGNVRQNGKGGRMQYNKPRPGSKDGNSMSSKDDKEGKTDAEKLDQSLAQTVNRGPEFDLDNSSTPEPKGDVTVAAETKDEVKEAVDGTPKEASPVPPPALEEEVGNTQADNAENH